MALTLKAARVNAGLTQKKAADKLGVSVATLHAYEVGKAYPNVCVVKRIEQAYGVTYNDIIFFIDDPI